MAMDRVLAKLKLEEDEYVIWKMKFQAWTSEHELDEVLEAPHPMFNQTISEKKRAEHKTSDPDLLKKHKKVYNNLVMLLNKEQVLSFMDVQQFDGYGLWKALEQKYERNTPAAKAGISVLNWLVHHLLPVSFK